MNDKEKPLPEIDFLRLKCLKLEADLMSTIAARDALQAKFAAKEMMEKFSNDLREVAKRDGIEEGWRLDLQKGKWVAVEG